MSEAIANAPASIHGLKRCAHNSKLFSDARWPDLKGSAPMPPAPLSGKRCGLEVWWLEAPVSGRRCGLEVWLLEAPEAPKSWKMISTGSTLFHNYLRRLQIALK